MLFSLNGLAGLTLGLIGVTALLRYRSMAPLVMLVLLFEAGARRLIIETYAIERSHALGFAWWLNIAMLAMLVFGLALSFWPSRRV